MSLTSSNCWFFILAFFIISGFNASAQSHDVNKSVQLYAEVDATVPHIIIHWDTVSNADNYVIYRKSPEDINWGDPVNTLDGNTSIFLDEDVETGQIYEYRVTKVLNTSTLGYGYIYCGMELEPIHFEGNFLLIIDTSFLDEISESLNSYEEVLKCSGWDPLRLYVDPADSVIDVKSKIVNLYEQEQYNITNILLIGHVPVPYSGSIAPDGHNNHVGAWPTDGFYGDMDGFWTDISVMNTSASSSRNHNIPGDGKYDQSVIPSDIEIPVGRVDFFNLPVFDQTEPDLLNQYFEKNKAFRMKDFEPKMRGLIENNFSTFEEGFGQNGLKNFSTLLGPGNYGYEDFDNAESDSYMWVYGCGGGTFTSASGISSSSNLAQDSVQAVFTMLFGSYFGDWDSENNFMRSSLGSGTVLSCSWAARPNWQYHPMGLGFNLGYCTLLSHNNPGFTYSPGFGNRQIHVGLMGDPSLKMHIIDPPGAISISESNGNANLEWETSTDTVMGYYIYRKTEGAENYYLLTEDLTENNYYIDSCLQQNESYDYLVRAVKLIVTPSGSFYGLSVGSKASQLITTDAFPHADFNVELNQNELIILNTSQNATNYFWEIPGIFNSMEEQPGPVEITDPDDYSIYLIASNTCGSDTTEQTFTISSLSETLLAKAKIFPNPVDKKLLVEFEEIPQNKHLEILNSHGQQIGIYRNNHSNFLEIDCSTYPNGSYFIRLQFENQSQVRSFIVQHK